MRRAFQRQRLVVGLSVTALLMFGALGGTGAGAATPSKGVDVCRTIVRFLCKTVTTVRTSTVVGAGPVVTVTSVTTPTETSTSQVVTTVSSASTVTQTSTNTVVTSTVETTTVFAVATSTTYVATITVLYEVPW